LPALADPKLEAFAQALLLNLAQGVAPSKAADHAAKAVGYGGSSRASNARKRAQRKDVKARMVEIASPIKPEVTPELVMTLSEAKLTLSEIARSCKAVDRIGSIRQLALMEGWEAPSRHEHTGRDGAPLFDLSKLSDDQLAAIETILAAASLGSEGGAELPEAQGKPH
jgi:hypothetical protein